MQRRYFFKLSAAGAACLLWRGDSPRGAWLPRSQAQAPALRVQWQRAGVFSAFDLHGGRYDIEPGASRVVERGLLGLSIRQYGSFGLGTDQLNHPVALAFASDHQMYVVDHGNSRIQVFDATGRHLRQIGGHAAGDASLANPRDLAFDSAGRLWVADTLHHRLQVFDRDGTSLARIGELGTAAGQFNTPVSLAFAPSGDLHVLDYGNRRIQVFGIDGALRGCYGQRRFQAGRSLAIAADGCVYVADTRHASLEVFDAAGRHQQQLQPCFADGIAAVPLQLAFAPTGDLHIAALRGSHLTRQAT